VEISTSKIIILVLQGLELVSTKYNLVHTKALEQISNFYIFDNDINCIYDNDSGNKIHRYQ
jgi:hypothetical protein